MAQDSQKIPGSEDDQIIARLALKHQFLSDDQLMELMPLFEKKKLEDRALTLRDYLLDLGVLNRKQLDFLERSKMFLGMRQADIAFGRLAVKTRAVPQEEVDKALQVQAETYRKTHIFRPIGDILVEAGVLSKPKRDAIQTTLERIRKEKASDLAEPSGTSSKEPKAPPPPRATQQQPGEGRANPPFTPSMPRSPDPEEAELNSGRILIETDHLEVIATADGLKAFLRIKEDNLPNDLDGEGILDLLERKGIVEGLIDKAIIDGYLKMKGAQRRPLRVAKGIPPTPGRHAEIRYFFDPRPPMSDPLDDSDGPIDLKNRGVIPQVKPGDIIAEKAPRSIEIPGTDICGRKIATEQARDLKLLAGPGAELSHDGLKVLALVGGRPQLTAHGTKVSVLPELRIAGDIGFETGNVSFDGIIYVQGIVQDGFKVKGHGLVAKEIAKAEVEVTGNVFAYGGILGATIKCQGNVRAIHIHTARIEAQGSVIVDKGIFDSRISTSGKCISERGKIISSKIVAKQGVEAHTIGSELSQPSSILVGVDPVTEREIERLKALVTTKQQEKVKLKEMVERLKEQSQQEEKRIGELAQVQDRGALKKRSLMDKLEEFKQAEDNEKIAGVQAVLLELDTKIKEAGTELDRLFARQDEIRDRISAHLEKPKEIDQEIAEVHDELEAIHEWVMENPGSASVRVFNTAFSGNVIRGPFSSLTLSMNIRSSLIREAREIDVVEEGSPNRWIMHIQGLR